MINFDNIQLTGFHIHEVGNKLKDEGINIANKQVNIENQDTSSFLLKYFLSPFNHNECFSFSHSSELDLNELFVYSTRLFQNPTLLYDVSIDIAKLLYEKSTHPKINKGELCVCYFTNCVVNDIICDAIGLFKSEAKDVFLKFNSISNSFFVNHDTGVNINKLDKGSIIFNIDADKGYKVFNIDTHKSNDSIYWKNEFLQIIPASDNYHFTKNFLTLTNNFVTNQLPDEFDISKPTQIDLLNRSVQYFKLNETFDKNDFENKVLQLPEVIQSFQNFELHNSLDINNNFDISMPAVKKQARIFKSIIKLDKNFHIYIHGDKKLIEQGIDPDGRKYYKLFYDTEQ